MNNCYNNCFIDPSNPYGNYRTRTFIEIFDTVDTFVSECQSSGIESVLSATNLRTLYYLLYAKYGNSHIANSDENQFKYKVYSTIFMYGPAWQKRLELQKNIQTLSDEEVRTGGKSIFNHSFNPSTVPSTSTLEELPTINEQNTNNFKRGKLEGYEKVWYLIATDVTKEFIDKFKYLFLTIVEPYEALYYTTDLNEEV